MVEGFVIFLVVSLGLVTPGRAVINTPSKLARAYCLSDGDTLWSRLILDENTDPTGVIIETVMENNMRVPNNNCDITRSGTVITLDVRVPLTANGQTENGNCFRVEASDTTGSYVEFHLLHQLNRNGFDEVMVDWDRVYSWRCYRNMAVNLKLSTNIQVSNPNLAESLVPRVLPVELTVWRLMGRDANNNPQYEVIGANQAVPAGSTIRFQLTLALQTSFVNFIDAFGIRGYSMMVMDSQNANRQFQLIGADGCADTSSPFPLTRGLKYSSTLSSGDRYVLVSGDTTLFSFSRAATSSVTYMVRYTPCFDIAQRDTCDDMCFDVTGRRERKKRQTDSDEELYSTSFTITVVDNNPNPEAASETDTALIAVTVSVTVVVVLLVLLALVGILVYMRRRRDQDGNQYMESKKQLPTL